MEVKKILNEREKTYGQYQVVSKISQDVKKVIRNSPNYPLMPDYMKESFLNAIQRSLIANAISNLIKMISFITQVLKLKIINFFRMAGEF